MGMHKAGRNDAETPGASVKEVDKGLGGPASPGCSLHQSQAQAWCGQCHGMPVMTHTQDIRHNAEHVNVPAPPESIGSTLAERGKRYGTFVGHALVTQQLKRVMNEHHGWEKLADDQREALEMVVHKIGRILNGDPNYADSWHDIAGYAKLVDDRLNGKVR